MSQLPDVVIDLGQGIILDGLRPEDAAVVFAAVQDGELRRWLPLPRPYPIELAETWCREIAPAIAKSGKGLVRCIREGPRMVGCIDAKRVDWRAMSAELGYWMAPGARGRGVMTAAVSGMARWLIREHGFQRIELRIATGNASSRRVAEKAGFRREGVARNAGFTDSGRVDLVIFSRIPADG